MQASAIQKLREIKLEGFKSIGPMQTVKLEDINVLIGANGSGKSNLVSFFRLIEALAESKLQLYIGKQGYADGILHYGAGATDRFRGFLLFADGHNNNNSYDFSLVHSFGGEMMFAHELHDDIAQHPITHSENELRNYGSGHSESRTPKTPDDYHSFKILDLLKGIKVFQFHDTSDSSPVRKPTNINDNRQLQADASNLPAFLYQMKLREDRNPYYQRIVRRIGEIMPQFRDFDLRPMEENPNMIRLDWIDKHQGHRFGAHQTSDGSLRFMALATLLLQPKETLPKIIVIDEPELGLHPEALMDLVGMIKIAAANCQIILSTQSSFLMNLFEPQDIITVSAEKGYTEFKRLDIEGLIEWYGDYTLAELWEKNLIGGRM